MEQPHSTESTEEPDVQMPETAPFFPNRMIGLVERYGHRRGMDLTEQFRHLTMLVLWILALFARMMMFFVPNSQLLEGLSSRGGNCNSFDGRKDGGNSRAWAIVPAAVGEKNSSIYRALDQVLELINEIPTSSRKYAFALEVAEKVIHDNANGGIALLEVNQMALVGAFYRTIQLLTSTLKELQRQQQADALGWPGRLLKGLPMSSISFIPLLSGFCGRLGDVSQSIMQQGPQVGVTGMQIVNEEYAEKYAQELLWLARKLKDNYVSEVAIIQWSSATDLACLSRYANPRVQRLLLKLSAILSVELASGHIPTPSDVVFKFLLLWLPLLCTAPPAATDGTIFSTSEKVEIERMLERAIRSLPDKCQETILALWLREFSLSSSDWPKLQNCYDEWCQVSRNLRLISFDDKEVQK